MNESKLPTTTAIGPVHLTVADLAHTIEFYTQRLGMVLRSRDGDIARLGTETDDLLVVNGRPGARRARGTTGLYHFAILVPSRGDLARVLRQLVATRTPLQGASDHGVSEALYLADPEGNGIEIYRDRPRAEWPERDGRLEMVTEPLDVAKLLAEAGAPEEAGHRLAAGTRMGHVHLHVSDLDAAERFYTTVLGFELMQRYGGSALFVSAGGYHHHVGLNTWAGPGAPPPPEGSQGLRHFDVRLPDAEALKRVIQRAREAGAPIVRLPAGAEITDPSGNHLLFTTRSTGDAA